MLLALFLGPFVFTFIAQKEVGCSFLGICASEKNSKEDTYLQSSKMFSFMIAVCLRYGLIAFSKWNFIIGTYLMKS
jgi:hypothetical protein